MVGTDLLSPNMDRMKKKSVYIIEKDNTISDLLKFLLEKRFDLDVRTYGEETAFQSAMIEAPDLVIMHFNLRPGEEIDNTGLQTIRNLKANFPVMPIILFSAQINFKLALERLNCGADQYLNRTDDDFYEQVVKSVRHQLKLPKDSTESRWGRVRAALASIGLS